MDRSVSTISEELKRNTVAGTYTAKKADHKADVRRKASKFQVMKIINSPPLREFVEAKLREGRSPGSIAGRVRNHEKQLSPISADSIERFLASVHGRQIEAERKRLKAKRRKRKRRKRVHALTERTFIDQRPKIINDRKRVGDAEADFIISGKDGTGILLTVADRKLRVSFVEKVLPVSIANVHAAFLRVQARYPELRTITTDNDILLRYHKQLELLLGIKIYFCNPYHSWEKGTIENTNGVIRDNIPKSSDISCYSKPFITKVELRLNDRYMACLNYATPQEELDRHRERKTRLSAHLKQK